jgi:aspartyl-tRNA(Asn)/glutamyl-tRNA(Gln) amidotransferase subunit A
VAGLPTTGVGGRGGAVAADDYLGIERLRRAGAIVVGTNTMFGTSLEAWPEEGDEAAYDWDREARNPWDTERLPGVSSAGSAAATAAGLVPISIGSDGGGSSRTPPAFCGVVGLHPTPGRVPHVDYVNPSLFLTLSIGPIARDVRDVALALGVMAGPDGRDFACLQDEPDDYVAGLDDGVAGLRFAWTDDFGYGGGYSLDETPRVTATVRRAAERLRTLGGAVEQVDTQWDDPAAALALGGGLPFLGWPGLPSGEPPKPDDYRAAAEARALAIAQLRSVVTRFDLILSPTTLVLPPTVEQMPASYRSVSALTMLFNWVAWPALTVPCGLVDGLPVGLHVAGRPGDEARLLRVARAVQAGDLRGDDG